MAINNPFVIITNINVKLSIKEKTDSGIVTIVDDSVPIFVPFNKTFLDVRSIVVSARYNATHPKAEAKWIFGTEIDGGFSAYIVDNEDGSFLTGDFSWIVRGV